MLGVAFASFECSVTRATHPQNAHSHTPARPLSNAHPLPNAHPSKNKPTPATNQTKNHPPHQSLSGGQPVRVTSPVGGDDLPLWGMQIDVEQSRADLKAAVEGGGGKGLNDFLDGLGLGMIAQQLKELSLGELLDTPPPGVDEAIAIAKVRRGAAALRLGGCLGGEGGGVVVLLGVGRAGWG